MKLNSSVVRLQTKPRNAGFLRPASALRHGRLDTVFNSLLLATGIALSVAGAAQSALDTGSGAVAAAQNAAKSSGAIRQIAVRGDLAPAQVAGTSQRAALNRS